MTSNTSPIDLPADKTMLDAVMYIATLVSKSTDVDPQLDRVRAITAQRSGSELTQQDNRELDEVYTYIEDYLVEKEALRSFTRESIREKLAVYLRGGRRKSTLMQPLIVIWTIAIGSALAAMAVPESFVSSTVKITLALTAFIATLHVGAVWMFWTGLRNFKDKIRKAYLPICIGIAIVGIALLEVPIAVALGEDDSIWFRYIASSMAIPIAEALFYIGMRRFAQIGGVKSRLLSVKMVIGLCIGLSLLMVLLPRPSDLPLWVVVTSLVILTTGAVLSGAAAGIIVAVRRSLSAAYQRPMLWFMMTLLISTYSCIQYAILQMMATVAQPYDPGGLAIIPLLVSGLVILQAGVSFRGIDTAVARK